MGEAARHTVQQLVHAAQAGMGFGAVVLLRQATAPPPCVQLLRSPLLPQRRHPRRLWRLDVEILARVVVPLPRRSGDRADAVRVIIAPAMKYVDLPSLVGGDPRAPRNR